jgi:3-deoxy-D-manno-octulosonate 8-phosphate phosphatase (KDO 8-P phosphatase)
MNKKIPKNIIIDVDGVLSTGQFFYNQDGKVFKIFGRHDNDGLKIVKNFFSILFITADIKGFKISKKRIVDDMGFELRLISESKRYEYIKNKYGLDNTIYIGDGIYDAILLKKCKIGLCPADARIEAKKKSNKVLKSRAGEGAILDASLLIMKKFYKKELDKIFKI